MKHVLLVLIAMLLTTSCASTRYAQTDQVKRDSTYNSSQRLDSIFRSTFHRDSIYARDSIYVREKGDTITKYVEKLRYQYKIRRDTIYRDRLLCDTMYIERVDSLRIDRPVYIEKPLKWHQQAFIWVGRLCFIAVLLWCIFLYLKRKF